jgi:hypothetical protein
MSDAGLSPDERRTLSSVLDEIIPPSSDGRLPGAGAIGLAGHVEDSVKRTRGLLPVIVRGLAALDGLARDRGQGSFVALPRHERVEVLNQLATTEEGFLPGLISPTYIAYYQHPRVLEALGLEPRPPYPKGYDLAPFDPALLDGVRRRRPHYRDVPPERMR